MKSLRKFRRRKGFEFYIFAAIYLFLYSNVLFCRLVSSIDNLFGKLSFDGLFSVNGNGYKANGASGSEISKGIFAGTLIFSYLLI